MLRSIAAVIVTYIVMVILIMGAFAGLLFGMGPDRLLEPGSWKGTLFFSIAAPSITVLSGLFGGWLCAKIARGRNAVIALAAVVLVLSFISAYSTLQKPEPTGPRESPMTIKQFMEQGREPTWLAIFNPLGGAAAVLIAGLFTAAPRMPRAGNQS